MVIEFSLHTAIIGTLGSTLIIAATLFYLWRLNPEQPTLFVWGLAFAAQGMRMAAQLGVSLGAAWLSVVTDLSIVLIAFLVWHGSRRLAGMESRLRGVFWLLIAAAVWIALGRELPFVVSKLPIYLLSGTLLIDSGRILYVLGKASPGLGQRMLALLFVLLGLHYFGYPFLIRVGWFAPIGFSITAALTLGIGICMMIIMQRRQQRLLSELADRLVRETAERRASSERFKALAESSELGVVVADPEGNFIYNNLRFLALTDSTPEEVRSGAWREHLHPEDRLKLEANWRQAVAAHSGFSMERRIIDSQGQTLWARVHVVPVSADSGAFRGFVVTVEDISKVKESEHALRLSEAKFAGAFHASLDYMTLSDFDSGEIIEVNEAFERVSGWSRADALGKTPTELGIWPENTVRDEVIRRLRSVGNVFEYPLEFVARSGKTISCLLNASPINIDERRYLLSVVRDVSARKAAAEALRQSEEKFSRIVHYAPVPLIITEAESGIVIDVNRAWQELFGYAHQEMIGRNSRHSQLWFSPQDHDALYEALANSGDGTLDRHECRHRRADGAALYTLISCRRFDIGGRPCYIWGVTDLTLRRQAEERMAQLNSELEARVAERSAELLRAQGELLHSEKLAALGSLVAGVAHELNTPIGNSVTVASTLHERTREFAADAASGSLRRSSLNAHLEAAQTASDLLLRNLDQARRLLTSFKQVAADQTSDQRRSFDLRKVIDEVLLTLSPTLRKTPYTVSLEVPAGIVLDSYPGPLGQVISNFINNALIHAFQGRDSGCISIRASVDPAEQIAVMEVEDDGIGVEAEYLSAIFDPFFTTKLGQGGSGLGLHIVYNIVTGVLGGSISVESVFGRGTKFVLKMPLFAPNGSSAHNPEQKPPLTRS